MINKNDLRKAISSIAISNAKRNTIYKAFSDLDSITKEEFDSVKSDISKVVESMLTKDTVGKANGVASLDSNGSVPIEQLSNIDTTLFLIVRELPTTDIKTNKIYLVPNQDGQGNNVYIEYLYVENVWEKLGEFKAKVDLSEYVKSNEIYQCIKKEYDSSKRGANSIAIDDTAKAPKKNSIAIGNNAQATQLYSIAVGDNAEVTQPDSIAFGNSSQVTNSSSVALGTSSLVTGQYSTALGRNSKATNHYSIALGFSAKATGFTATALGASAKATSDNAIAIGNNFENNKSIFSVGFNRVNGIEMDKDNYGLYLKGFGGYTGTNLTVTNNNVETLNPDIKSVQEIINSKADLVDGKLKSEQLPKLVNIATAATAEEVVTKFNALLADLKAKGYMEADIAQ